jgi:hypothetical protein
MVRLHVHTYRARDAANVDVRTAQGGYAFLCSTPCIVDVPPAAELRVSLGDSDDAKVFSVPNEVGTELDVEVRAPGKGGIVGGIAMLAGAGLSLLIGAGLTAYSTNESSRSGKETLAAGIVFFGIGAGLGLGGILLIANRSHEPRVKGTPYRPGRDLDDEGDRDRRRKRDRDRSGRDDTMLGDLAAARHQDALALPPAFAPLQLDFTF